MKKILLTSLTLTTTAGSIFLAVSCGQNSKQTEKVAETTKVENLDTHSAQPIEKVAEPQPTQTTSVAWTEIVPAQKITTPQVQPTSVAWTEIVPAQKVTTEQPAEVASLETATQLFTHFTSILGIQEGQYPSTNAGAAYLASKLPQVKEAQGTAFTTRIYDVIKYFKAAAGIDHYVLPKTAKITTEEQAVSEMKLLIPVIEAQFATHAASPIDIVEDIYGAF